MWFRNYLSDRSQRVTVNGVMSTSMPTTSGVPQGSLLGPFLFSVYINDLSSYISTSTGMGLFADDTKCYRCIRTSEDGQALQEDILGLYQWSNDNNLRFNIPKCKVLSISRKVTPFTFPYNLNRHQQIRSNVESDLGITLHSKLLWNDQVNKVRSKANKLLGLIRRSTLELTDINAREFLYLQLVRSNFAYTSQVWCPQTVKLVQDVEKMRRRETKHILNLGFLTDVSDESRLKDLDMLPMTYWHEYLDLILLI